MSAIRSQLPTNTIQSGGKEGQCYPHRRWSLKHQAAQHGPQFIQPGPCIEATEAEGGDEAENMPTGRELEATVLIPPTNIDNPQPYLLNQVQVPFLQAPLVLGALYHGWVTFCAWSLQNMQMLICVDDSMSIYLFVLPRHWTLIIWPLAVCMIGSFVLSEVGM